jgi:hypothetical protein
LGPVTIATRAVDIPEYLGELGIYVARSAAAIAGAIVQVESGQHDLHELGQWLCAKALRELDYNKISQELSGEYSRIACGNKPWQTEPTGVARFRDLQIQIW